MFTISLDESSGFESYSSSDSGKKSPIIVAGMIFDDKGIPGEKDAEEMRFASYMELMMDRLSREHRKMDLRYPRDLHTNNKADNKSHVAVVKEEIKSTLADFLTNCRYKGTKIMPERKGTYHLYAMVKSEKGVKSLGSDKASYILRDNFASNTYIHMTQDTITKLIFHNPVLDIDKVKPLLPTRATPNLISEKKREEYQKFGYKENEAKRNTNNIESFYYTIPLDIIYKTAIDNEARATGKEDVVQDMLVKSIDYNLKGNFVTGIAEKYGGNLIIPKGTCIYNTGWKYTAKMDVKFNDETLARLLEDRGKFEKEKIESEVFFYMADIIVDQFTRIGGSTPEEWIQNIYDKANKLTGHKDNIIFGYDDIEVAFNNAYKKYEAGDFYGALEDLYSINRLSSEFKSFYKKHWVPLLKEKIQNDERSDTFESAISKLNNALRSDNLNQLKMKFIFEGLEAKASNFRNKGKLYDLYDAGIAAYNHLGRSDMAEECFKKCQELVAYAGAEKYLSTRNKYAVFLCDSFQFEKAKDVTAENDIYQGLIYAAVTEMSKDSGISFGNENYGKSLSQSGQVYAYLGLSEAEEKFKKALSYFEKGSPNYNITMSYLLHYYLMIEDREKYEEAAKEYFDGRSVDEQFDFIVKESLTGRFNVKYAMYVYIKSIYKFYLSEISDKTKNKIWNIRKSMLDIDSGVKDFLTGDPWEHIRKYIAIMMYREGEDKKKIDKYVDDMKLVAATTKKKGARPSLIEMIVKYGEIEVMAKIPERGVIKDNANELCRILNEDYGITTDFSSMDMTTKLTELSKFFPYMYS